MKKLIGLLLCFCMLMAAFPVTTFAALGEAAETIETFGITMNGFHSGVTEEDVTFSLSDDRLEISEVSWVGAKTEKDTFYAKKEYNLFVTVKVKSGVDANFSEDFGVEDVQTTNLDKVSRLNLQSVIRKNVKLHFIVKTDATGEMITAAEEEALKHKHCYCGGYINIGDHTSHTEVTYSPISAEDTKITYTQNVAYVYLTEDVVIPETLNIGGNKTLYLCLNGHALKKGSEAGSVINVKTGGKLYLCNCTRDAGGQITGGWEEYGAGIHSYGTVYMYGGVITKNKGGYGGGVYNHANFFLYGGDIYDNEALYGGGVWNANDSNWNFVMYEGTITLNTSVCGGGIWNNDNAVLTLKGGVIQQNIASTAGGGIWNNGGTLEIDGAMLLENISRNGGGVWNNGGTFFLKSGNISKNIGSSDPYELDGYAGGVWNNGGLFHMSGGEITFNRSYVGGGVWVNDGSEFVMTSGVIAENEAVGGAGIYIQYSDKAVGPGTARLSGNAGIVSNYGSVGGGAYVKGILNMEGEAEIILNEAEEYADIAAEDGGVVNQNAAMPTKFIDVPQDAYYLEPVKWAVEKGITTGTTDVTFSPDEKCLRGQVVTFLYRMHGSPETDGFYFADTKPSDYFYDATRWAWELKMERTAAFSPNHYCSRAAAIRYMWIAAGSPQVNRKGLPFTDIPEDANYRDAVAWALETGITTGTTPVTFSPDDSCTRAQIVTFLYRAFK
ncbi:MAG: S-layer homology domain-containing protein [Clostridia bacterium]|nr:S-layer homology domain-containing protein [Clostridia bacterium]